MQLAQLFLHGKYEVWKSAHIISSQQMPCYSVPMVVNKLLKIMRLLPRIDAINSIFERIGLQYLSGIYV